MLGSSTNYDKYRESSIMKQLLAVLKVLYWISFPVVLNLPYRLLSFFPNFSQNWARNTLTQNYCFPLLEAADCCGWTQHAQYFWREWCCLCKSNYIVYNLRWKDDNWFIPSYIITVGWSSWFSEWWFTPSSKKSKIWEGL